MTVCLTYGASMSDRAEGVYAAAGSAKSAVMRFDWFNESVDLGTLLTIRPPCRFLVAPFLRKPRGQSRWVLLALYPLSYILRRE